MRQDVLSANLSDLSTHWPDLLRAHAGAGDEAHCVRRELLGRYGGAVLRYLQGAARDAPTAEDLYQDFAVRFLRGDFQRADPQRGRFRDFLKTALIRLVTRARTRRSAAAQSLTIDLPDLTSSEIDQAERSFLVSWRAELLARTWQQLERRTRDTGRPLYPTLRLRVDHPKASSDDLAQLLSDQIGKVVSAAAYRQMLHRTREVFAELLRAEVVLSLTEPTAEEIDQELADLGLLRYCRLPTDSAAE